MRGPIKVIANKLDKSILLTPQKPLFSLIWLHGLGDTSAGFLDYFQLQCSPVHIGGRVKLLHAPFRPVTINGGIPFTSWYDIRDLSGVGKEEERFNFEEVRESLGIIDQHVLEEIRFWKERGIKGSDQEICRRIFIGGFSQGCAMSLCYGLSGQRLLGGIIGYSGHLFECLPLKNKEKVPMLVYHGDSDDVLNFSWVKPQYLKHLKALPNFTFKLLQGLPHSVCEQQLAETTEWIGKLMKERDIHA